MKRLGAILLLLPIMACNTSEPPTSLVQGAQCSKTATYYDGSTEFSGKAWSEGNGIVSQPRRASNAANGAQSSATVVADCMSGDAISVGFWGAGDAGPKVEQFLTNARRQGLMGDLDGLLASAKQSGFPQSQSFRVNFESDADLKCACQLAASGKLAKARN
ncbi:MAG: hypothetical protein J0L76_15705 [Rhodobacterales bacterium]|nr:hypothetical protein [Rhodobacterales bacterium]